jgi:HD-GYP domain-containing protein (c-di-GMP phosphodiesterase class II)
MAYELFEHEQRVVSEATASLAAEPGAEPDWRQRYGGLLSEYERLLKQTRHVVRLSDRTQERMNRLSLSLESQNQQLEEQTNELAAARTLVERKVEERTAELVESRAMVSRLLDIGIALSAERDSATLMERILVEAKDLTNADGGTLYIRTRDDKLAFEIIRSDSLNYALGGTSGAPIGFPPLPMYDPESGEPNHKNVATYVALTGKSVNIPDAYSDDDEFDFSGTKKFDQGTGYHSKSFLTVPMKNRAGTVIGVLQLINARATGTDEVIGFPREIETYVDALSSQAAVALENQNLLEAQKALLDSFIELIAGAIDEKSPYTGGHCNRVPECAMLLAKAACATDSGPFAGFNLTEEEWYEFRIAGWLHDCGKVTTPEYVVDKATKLETIYNRIHEIRMRFEVLRRDAEVAYWRGRAEGGDEAALAAERDAAFARIADDYAFVAECNIGGEFMDKDKIARIGEIAKTTWTRHLDDRLGLAHDELMRKERLPAPELPVEESLLADRVDHIIYRRNKEAPFGDNRHGFRMDVPEHEYDYGEVHNLCIQRGTLSNEERYKINHHIVQTIIMLEQLPFPKHLERVPEYAGGHHEKMDGKGYPRGLDKEKMSIPARIMAIADIFEALTASDRPYKKAKTLSESLRIMGFMCKDRHIDPELYRLFLESGVYKTYAEEFLRPEQIDEVDVAKHLEGIAA